MNNRCSTCGKQFSNIYNLQTHLNRDKPCVKKEDRYKCKYCGKKYFNSSSLKRHVTGYCSAVKKINNKNSKNNTGIGQHAEHGERNAGGNINGNSNDMSVDSSSDKQIITNNITIIKPFNKCTISSGLTKDELIQILSKERMMSIPEIIRRLHFDPDKPEFHNVYIPSLNHDLTNVYDGKNWDCDYIKNIVDTLIQRIIDVTDEILSDPETKNKLQFRAIRPLTDSIQKLEYVEKTGKKPDKESLVYQKKIKKSSALVLYNNRRIPMKTRARNEALMGKTNIIRHQKHKKHHRRLDDDDERKRDDDDRPKHGKHKKPHNEDE